MKTKKELNAHYERALAGFRKIAAHSGIEVPEAAEKYFRILFYLGWEAAMTEVGEIPGLRNQDEQRKRWIELCEFCQEGLKP